MQALRNARYTDAVEKFKNAVELDPSLQTADFIATAYSQQYIPGAQSPENDQMLRAAKEQFLKVLEVEPNNTVALASMAQLNYNETQGISDLDQKFKKLDESREWNEKLTKADPKNKEAFYSLGVIAWGKWYPILRTGPCQDGHEAGRPGGPLKDKKVLADSELSTWIW